MPPRSTILLAATLCGLLAVYLGWTAVRKDASLNVPSSVGLLAAGVFAVAAARMVQLSVRPHSDGAVFAGLIFAGFAGIAGWIALSPDAQGCTIGVNDQSVAVTAGLACRIPFGLFALMAAALTIYCALRATRPIFRGPARVRKL